LQESLRHDIAPRLGIQNSPPPPTDSGLWAEFMESYRQ
jgi:hypothetical protein